MSILDRLNLLVRANINDRSTDARSTLGQMNTSIKDARRELARVRAGEKQIVEQVRAHRQKVDQWEDRAMLALKHGDEDLAREAIVMKNRAERDMEGIRDQLDNHRAHIRDIESALEALEMKLEGTRSRIDHDRYERTGARAPAGSERDWDAEMQRRLNARGRDGQRPDQTPPRRYEPRQDDARDASPSRGAAYDSLRRSFSQDAGAPSSDGWVGDAPQTRQTFENFDRMSRKIDEMEADIDAIRELSDDELMDPRKVELDRIFNDMEQTKRADDDLSDLKRKFSED